MEKNNKSDNTALTATTRDTSRKNSDNSWIDTNPQNTGIKHSLEKLKFYNKSGRQYSGRVTYMNAMLKNGLKKLGEARQYLKGAGSAQQRESATRPKLIFSNDYLEDVLMFCSEQNWTEGQFKKDDKTYDGKEGYGFAASLCSKGLKLVINVIRTLPTDLKVDQKILDQILLKLEVIVKSDLNLKFYGQSSQNQNDKTPLTGTQKNRHATYLSLKLLYTLITKFPDMGNKVSVLLLKSLGKQVNAVYKKSQQHKKMLKILQKLSTRVSVLKKSDLYRHVLDIDRDFKVTCYSDQIKAILFDNPLTFTQQTMEFFRDMRPEQETLKHLGKLLFELTKDPSIAERYFETYLAGFFDRVFTSAYFYWSNIRFILVYIANFNFVWSGLKFNNGFIKSVLRAVNLNPQFLELIMTKIEKFDEFLALHEIRYNPGYVEKFTKVQNPGEVIEKAFMMRVENLEQIGCYKSKKVRNVDVLDQPEGNGQVQNEEYITEDQLEEKKTKLKLNTQEKMEYESLVELKKIIQDFDYPFKPKKVENNSLNSIRLNRKYLSILRAKFSLFFPKSSILSPITYSNFAETHNHLLGITKYNRTDLKVMIGSKKDCPDIVLEYSTRTHKIIKCYKLDFLQTLKQKNKDDPDFDLCLNQLAPKTNVTISHAFLKNPVYNFERKKLEYHGSKQEILHMCLKTFGFQNIAGARRTGKSQLYIWKNNTDPGLKSDKIDTLLSAGQETTTKTKITSQTELLFYQEFREEIHDFMVLKNKLLFWGVSTYGIIDISEVKCLKESTSETTVTKFRAKLCYEKTFTNVLTKRVLPFNDRFVMLVPFRKEADIYLYNILGDYYSVLRLGSGKNTTMAREIKLKFIEKLLEM